MGLNRNNPRRDANEREIMRVCEAWQVLVTPLSVSGVPDLLCLAPPHWRDRCFLLEVKASEKSRLTEAQVTWHEKHIPLNPPVAIVWDVDTTMDALTRFRDGE